VVRVLGALDADQDFIISPSEVIAAPAALRRLDIDHDGKLSPEEYGFFLSGDPEFVRRARLEFMRANPALAALDADHGGEVSYAEILKGAAALKTLDKNGDGSLTPDEVIPDRVANQANLIFSRLDANHDGKISRAERASLCEIFWTAPNRNHNGIITVEELTNELPSVKSREGSSKLRYARLV